MLETRADLSRPVEAHKSGRDIATACFYLMKAGEGGPLQAADMARATHPRVSTLIERTVVGGASTIDANWAGPLADIGSPGAAFMAQLSNVGVFDQMFADMLKLPTDLSGLRIMTSISEGDTPIEGAAARITDMSFAAPPTGGLRKSSTTVVMSNELLNALTTGQAVDMIAAQLRKGTVAAVDRAFISILIAPGVVSFSGGGTSAVDVRNDLATALAGMSLGEGSKVYLIVPAVRLRRLAMMGDGQGGPAFPDLSITGGTISGIKVLPTDAIALGSPPAASLLCDATQVAGWRQDLRLDRARETTLELETEPTSAAAAPVASPSGPTAATGPMISLWQANASAVRVQRWWAAGLTSDRAVVAIEAEW